MLFVRRGIDSGVDTDWISLGFASTMDGNPWDNVGPWMLYRGNGQVTAFYNGLNGRENVIAAGSTTAARELAIVLDTTSALWSAEWLVDGTSVRTYAYTANPTINYVQLGGNAGMTNVSTFDNFSLSYVPEPSIWLASVCGVLSWPSDGGDAEQVFGGSRASTHPASCAMLFLAVCRRGRER